MLWQNLTNTCNWQDNEGPISCADPVGGQGVRTPSPENHKNIGFLSNTGPDPLKNYKATKPAFNVFGILILSSTKKTLPPPPPPPTLWQNLLDPRMDLSKIKGKINAQNSTFYYQLLISFMIFYFMFFSAQMLEMKYGCRCYQRGLKTIFVLHCMQSTEIDIEDWISAQLLF